MRIDGHQHFWRLDRGDYHWMDASVPSLCRDFLPEDLRPHLAKHAIDHTILVQAAQTVAETDYLLELAAQYDFIAGVVGWLDMESVEFARQFALYRNHPKFVGLRPMLQDIPDPAWILRPQVLRSLQLLLENDFPFDFLIYPRHLPFVLQVLERVGPLRAVIDHIAKPEIGPSMPGPWKTLIREAAQHENLFCKLSGIITEAGEKWNVQELAPYIQYVVECFGWDRIIFGSDWPVCLLAGSYDQVIHALEEALGGSMDATAREKLFGSNAARFYKLSNAQLG
jgi:L-fuconolactonase